MTLVDTQAPIAAREAISLSEPKDFLALLKPRVMSLVVLTAVTGLVVAPAHMNPMLAVVSILAIAIGAGAAGALNMWYDADIDAVMSRTAKRPVPAGRVSGEAALAFGLALSLLSVCLLGLASNWFAAGFLAFTIFFYAVIYTMGLKRSTPQNIVIGGAAGAFPPMIGYAAATGGVSLESTILFLIIFLWTPPHFWALALFKLRDYGTANVPMLPNVAGERSTRIQIFAYSLVLAPIGAAPFFLGYAGPAYGLVSILLGLNFLRHAFSVLKMADGDEKMIPAKKLFGFSILYLFGLFAMLLVDAAIMRLFMVGG